MPLSPILRRGILFFSFFLLACLSVQSQTFITGTVIDSASRQPVAFAHIALEDGIHGTTSSIEGVFKLSIPQGYRSDIYITHVSYQKIKLPLSFFSAGPVSILLNPNLNELSEITVTSGENPAFRIIRNAISNKKKNDPANIHSYQYISYNKFFLSMVEPTLKEDSVIQALHRKADTTKLKKKQKDKLKIDSIARVANFFLSESVTEKKVINPGKEKEKLLALKVSGYKSPIFANIATDYQPFSFYADNISLLGRDFLNPISKGTLSRYDFYLVDTTYYNSDTVFVIQFFPKKNKLFYSLKGVISISTDGFAIKNVIASVADTLAKTGIRIQQNYEKVENTWFPVQLNTDLDLHEYKRLGRPLRIQERSFFEGIKINPPLNTAEFGDIKVELSLPDSKQSLALLEKYRPAPLEKKDLNTYKLMDSVMRKVGWLNTLFESFYTARWPLGSSSPVDLDLSKLINFNNYEKMRVGAGLVTNDRFSKVLQLGGYYGYGVHDKKGKYGGNVKFNFNRNKDLYTSFSYAHDIRETGAVGEGHIQGTENFRQWVSSRYDKIILYKAEVGYRLIQNVHAAVSLSHTRINPAYSYQLLLDGDLRNSFQVTETGVSLRYTHKEDYINLNGQKVFVSQRFPSVVFSYTKALNLIHSNDFQYSKYDLDIKHQIKFRALGKTNLFLAVGYLQGIAPYGKLYNGRGSRSSSLVVDNYFQTMGLYEFTVSRYASFFLSHNFGNVIRNKKYSKPELIIYQHMGVGSLQHAEVQQGIVLQSMNKGYFESGVGLNNLIRINYADIGYFGFGISAFYRYGPYQLPNSKDNTLFLWNFGFTF